MPKFLIDVNLPYHLSIWNSDNFIHQKNINDEWFDEQIWVYAKENNLTIITKDVDFSNKMMLNNPPPKVIQGYKFNLFYPDLIDKTKSPQFSLERSDTRNTCIIRFQV